jgi:hypothetical protein
MPIKEIEDLSLWDELSQKEKLERSIFNTDINRNTVTIYKDISLVYIQEIQYWLAVCSGGPKLISFKAEDKSYVICLETGKLYIEYTSLDKQG